MNDVHTLLSPRRTTGVCALALSFPAEIHETMPISFNNSQFCDLTLEKSGKVLLIFTKGTS